MRAGIDFYFQFAGAGNDCKRIDNRRLKWRQRQWFKMCSIAAS
jgi:hypothetical protein